MPNIRLRPDQPGLMPGLVKIGMTDRDDVRHRMSDLIHDRRSALPFECVAARQIGNLEAQQSRERRSSTPSSDPTGSDASREFFQIDPEQVLAILAVLPGRDVTPRGPGQDADAQDQRPSRR